MRCGAGAPKVLLMRTDWRARIAIPNTPGLRSAGEPASSAARGGDHEG
jgi:hypothetical protein